MLNTIAVASIGLNAALIAGAYSGSRPVMFVVYGVTVGAFALAHWARGRYEASSYSR